MKIDQAVVVVVDYVKSHGSARVMETVRKLWGGHLHTLAHGEKEILAQRMLGELVIDKLNRPTDGNGGKDDPEDSEEETSAARFDPLDILGDRFFRNKAGYSISVLKFTLDDWRQWLDSRRAELDGLEWKIKAAEYAIRKMRESGVLVTGSLPKNVLLRVERYFEKAEGRSQDSQ